MTAPRRPDRRHRDDGRLLPDITDDERAIGWGDDGDADETQTRDERWYRRERPPHHE